MYLSIQVCLEIYSTETNCVPQLSCINILRNDSMTKIYTVDAQVRAGHGQNVNLKNNNNMGIKCYPPLL